VSVVYHNLALQGSLKLGTADGSSRLAAQKERKSRQPPRERMKIEKLRPSQSADSSSVDASASEPEITSTDVKEVNNEGTLEKGESTTANPKTDQDVTDIDNAVEVQQTEKKSEDSSPSLDSVEHPGNSEITVESGSTISDEKSEPSSSNQMVEIAPVVNLDEKDSVVSDTKERNATELPNNIGGTIKPHESKKASTLDSPESTETQHGQKPESVSVKEQDQLEEVGL
jgi:hypothetical protein